MGPGLDRGGGRWREGRGGLERSHAADVKASECLADVSPPRLASNMRDDPLVDEEGYPSYNKPYSLMAWLEAEDIAEDYIMMLDGDMLLREPIDPVALGAARGRVVSAEYTYLVGTEPGRGFAERFIATKLVRRLAQVRGRPSRSPQPCPSGPPSTSPAGRPPHLNYYPLSTTHYLLPTTHYLLLTTCYLLPATYYLLPTTHYLLPGTCYLLPTTYYPLPAACYLLLPTTYYVLTGGRLPHLPQGRLAKDRPALARVYQAGALRLRAHWQCHAVYHACTMHHACMMACMQVRAFGHSEPETFFRESIQLPPGTDEATTAVRRKQAQLCSTSPIRHSYSTLP